MKKRLATLGLISVLVVGCGSAPPEEQAGPIAKIGTVPTIDGVFAEGEWDDALAMAGDSSWQWRIKHDGTNLYLAVDGTGGNLYFLRGDVITVLHASYSLGTAEYTKSDSSSWACSKEYAWELYKLQEQSASEINEGMTGYLAANGWVGSLMPMGTQVQTEFAISFDWLGITDRAFAETPKVYVWTAANLPAEELNGRSSWWSWPPIPEPSDSVNYGDCPPTISTDPSAWGVIRIDLGQ